VTHIGPATYWYGVSQKEVAVSYGFELTKGVPVWIPSHAVQLQAL